MCTDLGYGGAKCFSLASLFNKQVIEIVVIWMHSAPMKIDQYLALISVTKMIYLLGRKHFHS